MARYLDTADALDHLIPGRVTDDVTGEVVDAKFVRWGEFVVVDTYNYLLERLEYDPALDDEVVEQRAALEAAEDEYGWGGHVYGLQVAEVLAERLHDTRCEPAYGREPVTVNTYNGDCALNDVLQWVEVPDPDGLGDVILLQVHQGGDVRGNYSDPVAFRWVGEAGMFGHDVDQYELYCHGAERPQREKLPGMPDVWTEPHRVEVTGCDLIDREGSFTTEEELWEGQTFLRDEEGEATGFRCPYCPEDRIMQVFPPFAS